jgi:hypothetical protein
MKWDGGHKLDLSGSGKGQVASTSKHGNGPSDSIKCGGCFVEKLCSMKKVIIIIIIIIITGELKRY